MSDKRFFIDTNIFVYSFDTRDTRKQNTAREMIAYALQQGQGCISYQVIQEFLNVATRKFSTPLTTSDAQIYLSNVLTPLCDVYASPGLFQHALEVAHHWRYSLYDSLIIAAAQKSECQILYSEDLQHQQTLDQLTIINPFRE